MGLKPYVDDKNPSVRLTRAEKAIEMLKRRPAATAGIQFDVDNVGDWLHVETSSDSPHGYGLRFADTSADGIYLSATADFKVDAQAAVTLNADGGNSYLAAAPGVAWVSSDGTINLTAGIEVHSISEGVHMEATSGSFLVEANTVDNQTIAFSISPVGGTFAISNLPTSAPALADSVWNDGGTLKIV